MLDKRSTILVVIDVQGNLAQAMFEKERLFASLVTLIRGARLFELPIIWMEQTPEKLGPTIKQIAAELVDRKPVAKSVFSCWRSPEFRTELEKHPADSILLCGIETHVCVYQTAMDLLANNYHVEIVADAVSSRFKHNYTIGLEKIRGKGAEITTVETTLFELQKEVDGERFKKTIQLIK